ncbi:oligosaccharide flippase family protein [Actinobacillus equuli]|uniref:oligosaccharide flippase family protein n=1 Tax=Actinobacillus equuli TaxID=718 RepID=UPI0024431813|nr:oligosaccharide flippase family protein [Actinobacillus equuli]WGE53198.1 oligosaccharide flippase family protein [Actinobacillus equuli subsp. haemolyticus]WGE73632.1 oligosaccharide flippase family protein [Actinobacillus equuli subsp. haemolyticus]
MKAVKDSVIYLGGELISKAVPFLLLPYLSRKLGVQGYGELSYYQTYLVLFLILVGLSQEGAVARYFYFYGKRSLNLVVSTGYAYTTLVGSIILAICWYFEAEIIAYLAISAVFQSFLAVQLSVRQCQKQAIPYMVIQSLTSFVSVILTVAMLEFYQTDLVEKRILAILFGNLIVFCLAYFLYSRKINSHRRFSLHQHKLGLMYLLGFGVPLLLHQASFYLKGQLDRIFIFHQFSQIDLGLYAMGAQIAAILMILLQALNKATLPYFYEGLKQKTITLNKVHKWAAYSLLFVPIPSLVMWMIPESVVVWLLGNQFVGTKYFIILFLLSTSLTVPYFILVNYLFYYGKNKIISLSSVLSTVVYVISLLLLAKTKIEYVPYASIIGGVSLLPILYSMTKRVRTEI